MACLFCQQDDGHLHEFRALEADQNIQQIAVSLQDIEVIARMEGGDVIALEAKYHLQCNSTAESPSIIGTTKSAGVWRKF